MLLLLLLPAVALAAPHLLRPATNSSNTRHQHTACNRPAVANCTVRDSAALHSTALCR
jgi:hypothetical protein